MLTLVSGLSAQRFVRNDPDSIVMFLDADTGFDQLRDDGLKMLRDDVADQYIATAGSDGCHVRAGFDLVRDDRVVAAVHVVDASDLDDVGTGAADIGTHGVQEVGQVDDVGLFRGILDDREASRLDGGQHDVHGGTDRDDVHVDGVAGQVVGSCVDERILLHGDGGAQHFEPFEVLVDGTDPAEVAAAGHGDTGFGAAAEQCAQQVVGGPQMTGQLVGYGIGTDDRRVDLIGVRVDGADAGTHRLQHLQHAFDVGNVGDILNTAGTFRQKGGRQNGDDGVLGTADVDDALQSFPSVDAKLIQNFTLLISFSRFLEGIN